MTEKEEVPKEETQEEPQEPNPLEEQEDEGVDLELQKQMQKATIDEGMFGEDDKTKKEKTEDGGKKSKKSKGVDFMDYANKNNIQINIEYEQEKHGDKKRKFDNNYQNYGNYKNKNFKKNFQKDGNNNIAKNNSAPNNRNPQGGNNNRNNYNKGNYNNFPRYKGVPKYGMINNKFDSVGMWTTNPVEQQNTRLNVALGSDDDIVAYLQELFGEDNLNKDIYIRSKLTPDGKIEISNLEKYYGLKNNNVTLEKICELVPKTSNLELVEENQQKLVIVKNFKDLMLTSLDVIKQNKRAAKMQNQQMNMFPQMGMDMMNNNYVAFNYYNYQNNYIMPGQPNMYPMNSFPPMYQQYQPGIQEVPNAP